MKRTELKTYFTDKVTASADITSFVHGWISQINDAPDNQYPLLLMVPASELGKTYRHKDYRNYRLTFYLFDKNQNESGQVMTTDDRDAKWDELQEYLDTFFEDIFENDPRMVMLGTSSESPDDQHIGQDDLIWVKVEFEVRTHRGE